MGKPLVDPVDLFLLSMDPLRGLINVSHELDRLADLDPKLKAVREIVERELGQVGTDDDLKTLAAVLWLRVRPILLSEGGLSEIRKKLGNGDEVLRSIEGQVPLAFKQTTLKRVVAGARAVAMTNSTAGEYFNRAVDEISPIFDDSTNEVISRGSHPPIPNPKYLGPVAVTVIIIIAMSPMFL